MILLLFVQLGLIFPLLSWAGFPPIDEGFQLAYSRRILNGEVPHRDFISIRPVLTPVLHTFDLLFSEQYAFRVSRAIVLVEYALIAFLGMSLVARNKSFSRLELTLISVLGMTLVMEYGYFTMAWYTVDGLLLSVAGLFLIQTGGRGASLAGYFLLGLSPLAKQNYGVVPVAALLWTKPGRRIESILAIGLGPMIYLAVMLWFGSLSDFFSQIGSQSQISYLLSTGCRPTTAVGSVILGILAAQLDVKPMLSQRLQQCLMFALALAFLTLPLAYSQISASKSWVTFYFLIGWFLRSGPGKYQMSLVATVVPMILAWSSSISFFHSTVAYFGVWLFGTGCYIIFYNTDELKRLRLPFISVSLVITGMIFTYIRTNLHTISFKEPSVFQITQPLSGTFPGAAGIYTSQQHYLVYQDIAQAVALLKAHNLESVVLADLPAWNVTNKKKNPIAMDWPYFMELGSEALRNRYKDSVINSKTTHGLVFFSEPILDKTVFPDRADDYNRMWDEIMMQFPNQITIGKVRIYTMEPLKSPARANGA